MLFMFGDHSISLNYHRQPLIDTNGMTIMTGVIPSELVCVSDGVQMNVWKKVGLLYYVAGKPAI